MLKQGKRSFPPLIYTLGKAKLPVDKRFFYEGELDQDSKPFGHGEAVNQYGTKFTGTWLNGVQHGLCRSL